MPKFKIPALKRITDSLPEREKLHGLTIRKFTVGEIQKFIADLMSFLPAVFNDIPELQGLSSSEILATLSKLDTSVIIGLVGGAIDQLMDHLTELCAQWFKVDEKAIKNISPIELKECLVRLWEVNRLGELIPEGLLQRMAGSKSSLLSALSSGLENEN
jgi:hypothetical protein